MSTALTNKYTSYVTSGLPHTYLLLSPGELVYSEGSLAGCRTIEALSSVQSEETNVQSFAVFISVCQCMVVNEE